MKTVRMCSFILGGLLCLSTPAFALFDGDYAPGNWTETTSGDGVIDTTSGAPGSISMRSNNNGVSNLNQDFTIVLLANGENLALTLSGFFSLLKFLPTR